LIDGFSQGKLHPVAKPAHQLRFDAPDDALPGPLGSAGGAGGSIWGAHNVHPL